MEESLDNKNDELKVDQTDDGNCGHKCGQSTCGTCAGRGGKLHVYDWLGDLPEPPNSTDLVEVQFKNTRKAYYRNSNGLKLKKGDIVAVESSPGHDIGEVTLIGRLVYIQMHKNRLNPVNYEFKRIYRVAKPTDLEKWEEAKGLEHDTMLESRKIAEMLHLDMKIGDVEYQGDRTKAIFYYIADERVDFRELIKVLADRFRVRIEMKQIGARQEAGRIGGIGPCGRELCCASWMSSFISVTTNSARIQDISLNPQKLAGQCGKLKCCLNYELDVYLDAMKDFPPTDIPLEANDGTYYFFKSDIFKGIMWYSPQKDAPSNILGIEVNRVREVIEMNSRGKRPDKLSSLEMVAPVTEEVGYSNVVELDDLTRFDDKNKRGNNNRNNKRNNGGGRRPDNRRPRDGQNSERQTDASEQSNALANNGEGAPRQPNDQQRERRYNNNNRNRGNSNRRFNGDNRRRDGDNNNRPKSDDANNDRSNAKPESGND